MKQWAAVRIINNAYCMNIVELLMHCSGIYMENYDKTLRLMEIVMPVASTNN